MEKIALSIALPAAAIIGTWYFVIAPFVAAIQTTLGGL